jgi:hypothetical protein
MLYAAFSSLVTVGYLTLYNQGVNFFGQHSVYLFNINFWPLILLGVACFPARGSLFLLIVNGPKK